MRRNYLKRFSTMLLAFVVAATMGITTMSYAADTDKDDKLTVNDVEAGATVTAYQIVKEEGGEWKTVGGVTIRFTDENGVVQTGADAGKNKYPNPTADQITTIAGNPPTTNSFDLTVLKDEEGNPILDKNENPTYIAANKPAAGMYLILVSGTGKTVYNPMIVSIDYDGTADSVSAASFFTNNAYAKKTTPEITKSNAQSGNTADGTTYNGTSAQVGDTVEFKIETTLPSYSKQYTDPVFEVTDKLDTSLELVEGFPTTEGTLTVSLGGTAIGNMVGNVGYWTTTGISKNGFTVNFTKECLRAVAGKTEAERKVVITYKAKVTDKATYGFDPNKNEAKISFSNDPKENTSRGEDKDDSKIYTFGIDANLNGTETTNNIKTHEVIKLNEKGEAQTISHTENGEETKVEEALEGATFTLYSDENCTKVVTTANTSKNGYMQMTGLKEGTYYLKETAAPAGYTVDSTKHTVEISAVYNDDGTLASYTVTIDGKNTSTYSATYANNKPTITSSETTTTFIVNTKVPGLPSTGGIGTYIFVVIGAVMMFIAAIAIARKTRKARRSNEI